MFTTIRRIVRAGLVGFWRGAHVSLASILVMTVTLFVIGVTIFIEQLLANSLHILQSKVDINVYFVPDAPQEEIDALRTTLEAMPDVAQVRYLSREEVLANYRERNRNNEVAMRALEELSDNPFGATIAIQARETFQYENIARFLEEQQAAESLQRPVIDEINYARNKEAIDTLTNVINAVEQASFITMIILLLAAVLITFNTIRLAIYTAREEIAVMRLVGASNTFIRGPFMLQGALYGLVSGALTLIIFYVTLLWVGPRTEQFFELNLFTHFITNFGQIFAVIVGTGVVLGLVSSAMAVARYLRV
jgi:cell division transport system permease protein